MGNLNTYTSELQRKGIICPQPSIWNDFYRIFSCKVSGEMPKPLILAAWWHTSESEKQERFFSQLQQIANNGYIDDALGFLNKLRQSDWYVIEK